MALLVDLIPAGRGRALGTFQSIEFIGSFLGAPLGGYIADLYGFKTTLAMCGVLSFLGFAVAMSSRELKSVSAAQSHRARHSLRSSLGSLKSWGMVVICCVAFARLFVMQGIDSTVFPLYANRQLGIDLSMIGLLIGARSGGLVVTTVSAGTLSDRVGRKPVLLAGLTLAGVVFSLYPLAKSVEWLLGLMVLDGVALGAYRTFFAFGAVVGPILLMVASDFLGLIFCFYIASAVVLVNLPVVLTLRKRASPQGS
jgi:MFS family permease